MLYLSDYAFKLYQEEEKQSANYKMRIQGESIQVFRLQKENKPRDICIDGGIVCSCGGKVEIGIPCRHMLCYYRETGKNVAESDFVPRWRRRLELPKPSDSDRAPQHLTTSRMRDPFKCRNRDSQCYDGDDGDGGLEARPYDEVVSVQTRPALKLGSSGKRASFATIMDHAKELARLVDGKASLSELVDGMLIMMINSVKSAGQCPSSDQLAEIFQTGCSDLVRQPAKAVTPGRQKLKRIPNIPGMEANPSRNEQCSFCRSVGHRVVSCPLARSYGERISCERWANHRHDFQITDSLDISSVSHSFSGKPDHLLIHGFYEQDKLQYASVAPLQGSCTLVEDALVPYSLVANWIGRHPKSISHYLFWCVKQDSASKKRRVQEQQRVISVIDGVAATTSSS